MPALGLDAATLSTKTASISMSGPRRISAKDHLAVMVWIYGGGFTDRRHFASATMTARTSRRKGVVLVSVAYRARPFGFLAHSGTERRAGRPLRQLRPARSDCRTSVGEAQHRCVRRRSRIASRFSANPPAEFPSACWPLRRWPRDFSREPSPKAADTSRPRAPRTKAAKTCRPLAIAEKNGAEFLSKTRRILHRRRAKDYRRSHHEGFAPGVRRRLLARISMATCFRAISTSSMKQGNYNDTPVLIGTNSDEGALFVRHDHRRGLRGDVHAGYGDYADKILAAYPGGTDAKRCARLATSSAIRPSPGRLGPGRGCNRDRQRESLRLLFQPPAALSQSAAVQGLGRGPRRGNCLCLRQLRASMPPSAADKAVSDEVSSYWVNFAKTGDPNGQGMPAWPAFTDAQSAGDESQRSIESDSRPEHRKAPGAGRLLRLAPQPSRHQNLEPLANGFVGAAACCARRTCLAWWIARLAALVRA